MPEAATAGAAAPSTAAPPAAAAPPAQSAGTQLASVPAGPDWATGFKNEEVKSYVSTKGFKTTEDLATSFYNLEKMKGVPEERLLKLPEKMEGDEARAVWEKLGAPKEPKGYELPRDEKIDSKFTDWAEGTFHKTGLTKTQAQSLIQEYNTKMQADATAQMESNRNAILQANETLKKEWGPHYETNLNLAKQGAKVLGLDAKTLDIIESVQGRAALFKSLQRIGVSVGESNFVDGTGGGQQNGMTPEQAQAEINALIKDKDFGKKINSGDKEATERWNKLNQAAAPGQKGL